ncbi:globin [Pseudomarimonas arenosa]|uniref:Globin n=1 Tax=Pseudomarimonas arenosa TaxID=2774145 RepID=A0AAW3ZIJ6_9GAMM|nr:globin [Pseudomarimonas arenosa]MBD8525823.1 globin [Pseudomarimonas arenosa]
MSDNLPAVQVWTRLSRAHALTVEWLQAVPHWRATMVDADVADTVQRSWRRLRSREGRIARAFYRHMFERRPEYRQHFQRDMAEQEMMFLQMVCLVLNSYEYGGSLNFVLGALGRRHLEAGVAPAHLIELSDFLLAALNEVEPLPAEEQQAWRSILDDLGQRMLPAATQGPATTG